jgi:hypothetical protein
MPSNYLQSGDFSTFGVPASTTAGQVTQASVLIDAYLKRTEGLVWMPDATGNPAYMAALTPRLSLTATAEISPGKNVVVAVTGGIDAIAIGDALVLDRANTGMTEVVVVGEMTRFPATVTLVRVDNEHASGAMLDQGLAIKQHLFMPKDRPVKTLAYTPVVRLLSGQGRYAYGRRGDSSRYMVDEFNLLASLTAFGGPPAWEFFPLISTGIDPETGQVWVPAGVMLAYYSEVNLWYVAGYAQANLPDQIKMACAQVINATAAFPEIASTGIKSLRAGDTQIQMFASSILSDDSKRYLDPFRAKLFV